jgi:putative tryptophan/tyrosine transport system substrate-binding protein
VLHSTRRSQKRTFSALASLEFLQAPHPTRAKRQFFGYVEGQNVIIEYRWANNQYDRLPPLAADLVRRSVAVIAATGGSASAFAAKSATATIPIVFLLGDLDPVRAGIVSSLNRPAGNLTGVSVLLSLLGAKRVELLHELLPRARSIGLLMNPDLVDADVQTRDVQEAGRRLMQSVHVLNATNEPEIDAAFSMLVERKVEAVVIAADPFLTSRRDQLIALTAR